MHILDKETLIMTQKKISTTRMPILLWALTMGMVLLCFLTANAQTQNPSAAPLTLQQVVAIARAKNPTLLAAEQNILSVRAQETQAGVRQNPYFTAYGTNVTNPANSNTPYMYSLQLARLFERGQKRRWRLDSARSTTAQTLDLYQDQERQVILQVKTAFTNMLLAKAALKLATDNLADFRHELDISRERYKTGDLGKLDYERLDLQLAQFETDESTAEQNLAQTSDQLQTLLGYEKPSSTFDIVGNIIPPVLTLTLPELEQRALTARPDYQAAQVAVRVADANVKLAYANGTTDPTLEGEYDHSGYQNSFGFYATIPIRIFDRNQGNKATSKYQAQAIRFSEIAARNQVFSDVDQAWVGYTTSKVLSDRYQGHYLDEAKDVLAIAQFAYEHGGLALIDYLNALQDDRSTSLNALTAYAQTWIAIHQLSYTTATEVVP
jgi:cobalt-zinc-cadmium efflux system outer membrane protein